MEDLEIVILEVKNLTIKFGELVACDDISFKVNDGEVLGIAGPNGAGKTTLFNCILGMYASKGKILYNGIKINGLRPDSICHLGVARTFQTPIIFNSMSVFQNIKIGAYFGRGIKDEKKEVLKIIEMLDLEGKENYQSSNLNLYDKKLTMLAVVLATNPKLLLLDEPMSGLSQAEIEDCMKIVKKINSVFGISIIIIEHLMKVITEISNRLMILDNGKIIKIGDPFKVCKDNKVIEVYLGKAEKHA